MSLAGHWSLCTGHLCKHPLPSDEFELTANTLQAHMKPQGKLILKPLIYLMANTQDELTLWPCCEPAVSLRLTP